MKMPAMKREQIFYSWMDDGDAKLNRYFIEECLKAAIKKLNRGTDVTEYAVVRDTKGLPGMVDIGRVILERIKESAVFVADVSIINPKSIRREEERPTPNPNVMFELGYAYNAKGDDAIIAVFNTARGDVLELPFDVRPKRILSYHAASEADLGQARARLINDLLGALTLCLKDTEDEKIKRNSIVVDAITQARLLTAEIDDWPDDGRVMNAIEHVTTQLEGAAAQDVLGLPHRNLLWTALQAFRTARGLAPTDENWPVVKKHIRNAAVHVNFLADVANFRPDEATTRQWIETIRLAPAAFLGVLTKIEAENASVGSVSNKLVSELEEHSRTTRMIALNGPDSRHPKFGEALAALTLRLRKVVLALIREGRLDARAIREACAELEALIAHYYPLPAASPDESA